MVDRCVLEHCEFAQGGQCCLACPKGLSKKIERRNAAERIEAFIEILKKVKRGMRREKEDGLPVGVCITDDVHYKAYISYNGRQVQLISTDSLEIAIETRADAAKAKKKGVFEEWLANFRAEKEMRKTAEKRPETEVPHNDEGT